MCLSDLQGLKPLKKAEFLSCLKARPTNLTTFSAACWAAEFHRGEKDTGGVS
jgi:hypothetical protein